MTSIDGSKPINREVYVGSTINEGDLLYLSGSTLAITSTSGSAAVAVADVSTLYADCSARTVRSGENIGVYLLGSGAIVRVRSTAVTYTEYERVHVGNTAGQALDNDGAGNGAYVVGTCVEPGGVAVGTAGGLVTVLLDTHTGTKKGVGNS